MDGVLNTKHKGKEESKNLIITNNNYEYSTIIEKSIEFTHSTTQFDLYKGFIYMFLSCFFKSIFSVLCKIILEKNQMLSSFHLLTFKAYFMTIITILVSLFYLFYQKSDKTSSVHFFLLSRNNLNLIILRSVLCVISTSLTIFALKYISISEVYSIYYIYPAIVILLSYFILNEKLRWFDFICLFSCFVGVILVVRPESIFPPLGVHKANFMMFSLVIMGATLKAFEDIIIRNVRKDIHCFIVPSVYSIISIILFPIPLCLTVNVENLFPSLSYADIIILVLIALFCYIYQSLITLAFQNENAGPVAMINYFQVLFMFLSDMIIFHRQLILLDILGTVLIFSFNFANGVKKALTRNYDLTKFKNKNPGAFIGNEV